jgi:hypothetical protein
MRRITLLASLLALTALDAAAQGCGPATFTPAPGSIDAGPFFGVYTVQAGAEPLQVAVGRFDGDRYPDLALADRASNAVFILLGDPAGSGTFNVTSGSPITLNGGPGPDAIAPSGIASADLDDDGHLDLVVVARESNTLTVLRGDGSGGFTNHGGLVLGDANGFARRLAVGDFNGDGHVDVAATLFIGQSLAIALGDGTGGLALAPGSPFPLPGAAGPYDIAAARLVGDDATLDLAITDLVNDELTVLQGDGAGDFTVYLQQTAVAGALARATSVEAHDLDGDGRLDLVVGAGAPRDVPNQPVPEANRVAVFFNSADGPTILGQFFDLGPDVVAATAGDFDRDGDLDLVATNGTPSTSATVGTQIAPREFIRTGAPRATVGAVQSIAADFNDDRQPDIAVLSHAGVLTVQLNDCRPEVIVAHGFEAAGVD